MSSIRRRPQSTQRTNNATPSILPIHKVEPIIRQGRSSRSRLTVALVAFSISCIIALTCWVCQKGRLTKVDENQGHSLTARSTALQRISASDHANITEFFPCINDVSICSYRAGIEPILNSHRKKSRFPKYSALPCAPPNTDLCFRGVYDGFEGLLGDAHKAFQNSGISTARNHSPEKDRLLNRVALILESLILHPEDLISPEMEFDVKPILLESSVTRQKNYTTGDLGEAQNFGHLHADYFESSSYVYTAILYDDPPTNLLGGETALVDFTPLLSKSNEKGKVAFGMKIKENETAILPGEKASKANDHPGSQPIDFTSGMIVEPKRGRLVLFTSGGENFHAPMEVKRGERPTYHFWFTCKQKQIRAKPIAITEDH